MIVTVNAAFGILIDFVVRVSTSISADGANSQSTDIVTFDTGIVAHAVAHLFEFGGEKYADAGKDDVLLGCVYKCVPCEGNV